MTRKLLKNNIKSIPNEKRNIVLLKKRTAQPTQGSD